MPLVTHVALARGTTSVSSLDASTLEQRYRRISPSARFLDHDITLAHKIALIVVVSTVVRTQLEQDRPR